MPAKRELIDTGSDKRYVRRDTGDRRQKAKTEARPGQGDRGDRTRQH